MRECCYTRVASEGEGKLETKALETDMWHNVFSQSDNTWKRCVVGGELVRFTNL